MRTSLVRSAPLLNVKRSESGMVSDPVTVGPDATLAELEREGWRVAPSAKAVQLTMNRDGIRDFAALIGVGNLGHALAGYDGFASRGFRICALLDSDFSRVGEVIHGMTVQHIDDLDAVAADHHISIGVIATPASGWSGCADRASVSAAVRSPV